jgi:predicted nuclease of predicted toxin-antitoxin system
VKFLVDMPLPPALPQWLATQGHDAVHAAAVGLDRSKRYRNPDARETGSANRAYRQSGLSKVAGSCRSGRTKLILFRGGDWSEHDVTAPMQQLLRVMGESELAQSIVVVDRIRVRRRRLPIA